MLFQPLYHQNKGEEVHFYPAISTYVCIICMHLLYIYEFVFIFIYSCINIINLNIQMIINTCINKQIIGNVNKN